jgi:hypothetical protein
MEKKKCKNRKRNTFFRPLNGSPETPNPDPVPPGFKKFG